MIDTSALFVGIGLILLAGFRLGTPVLLTALGETIVQRSGLFNLSLEGIMSITAFSAYLAVISQGLHWVGFVTGMLVGGLFGLLYALMAVTLRVDQVVGSLTIWLSCIGLTSFLHRSIFGVQVVPVTVQQLPAIEVPILNLPGLDVIVYLSLGLVIVFTLIIYRTTWGLSVSASGENPTVADCLGIRVYLLRYLTLFIGGMMAGLGGAYLSLQAGLFSGVSMIAGRGWIALAMVIFGGWNPLKVFGGALLFGITDALQLRLQMVQFAFPVEFLYVLPYVITIAALAVTSKRVRPPAALGIPWKRGE